VPVFGRADPVVVRHPHLRRHVTEIGGDLIDKGLWIDAGAARGLRDLLAVLVGTREEEDLKSVQPLEARHDVSRDRGVGVADMGCAVHVVDRRGDIEVLTHATVIAGNGPSATAGGLRC
jgi:hypothetical protein